MRSNSNTCAAERKPTTNRPEKPRPDFPLYAHKVGRWAKKVKGNTAYFTDWREDPKGVKALEQWLEQKDDLLAGRKPRGKASEGALTVEALVDQFLAYKEDQRDSGQLKPRSYQCLYATCKTIIDTFGKPRAVIDLQPADFSKLYKILAKTRKSFVALANEIVRARSVFKFALDCEHNPIPHPVDFGIRFKKPRQESIDSQITEHNQEHGDPDFNNPADIRLILDALAGKEVTTRRKDEKGEPVKVTLSADPALRAMVLLALNGGFGQADCSSLPQKLVDLENGWVRFARVKTSVPRRTPLWAETIAAIRAWLAVRPAAKDPKDSGLVFLTCFGSRWVKVNASGSPDDAVGKEFAKVLDKLGLKQSRRSFYGLRRTFETVGGATTDQIAVDVLMGHKITGMKRHYITRIGDDRLQAVVNTVRAWLFGNSPSPEKEGTEGGAS